jgi:hypothetical protein
VTCGGDQARRINPRERHARNVKMKSMNQSTVQRDQLQPMPDDSAMNWFYCDKRAGMFETIVGLFWTAALLYAASLSHMRQNFVHSASTLRLTRYCAPQMWQGFSTIS